MRHETRENEEGSQLTDDRALTYSNIYRATRQLLLRGNGEPLGWVGSLRDRSLGCSLGAAVRGSGWEMAVKLTSKKAGRHDIWRVKN